MCRDNDRSAGTSCRSSRVRGRRARPRRRWPAARLALGTAPERPSERRTDRRVRSAADFLDRLRRSRQPAHHRRGRTRASDRRRPARRARESRRCRPAPTRRPAPHQRCRQARARDRARRRIRARRARTRAGALALRNIHDRRPAGEPSAREPPGGDHPARRPRASARRARSGPQDARIRDAIALSRIGGDGRPHPRSALHPDSARLGRWHGRGTELAGRCARPADRSGLERYPSRPRPRLDSRGAGPSVQPFPFGVRCAFRRSRREAASHLSRARTPGRRHRPAPRHLPSGRAHRGKRRLHVGGGIQPGVQAPLWHATGSLATRYTSEILVSGPRAAMSLCSVAEAPVLVPAG